MKDLVDKLLSVCFPDDILSYFELIAIEEHKTSKRSIHIL